MKFRPKLKMVPEPDRGVVLKPFEKKDIKQLISWITSPHLLVQWGGPKFEFPLDKSQLKDHLKKATENPETLRIFSVYDEESGEHVGHCELNDIDYQNKKARACRMLVGAKESRGLGCGEQIMFKLLNYAFYELGLEEVELNVFAYNKTAIYCYQKVGFKITDVQKEKREFAGKQYDLLLMRITKSDFDQG